MVTWGADNRLTRIAEAMGSSISRVSGAITVDSIVPYQSTRRQGGAIMGADLTAGAVNTFGQTWDVSTLFVPGADNAPQNEGDNRRRQRAGGSRRRLDHQRIPAESEADG